MDEQNLSIGQTRGGLLMVSIEKKIDKELKRLHPKARWVEWNTREADIRNNLQPGEQMIFLCGVWVAYEVK